MVQIKEDEETGAEECEHFYCECSFLSILPDFVLGFIHIRSAPLQSPARCIYSITESLFPTPSLFALLKSDQAQLCSFSAQRLPRDAAASSSASEKVNQRGSAGLRWPEKRAFAPIWWKMSVPTGAPFTPAKRWFFTVQRGQADS